MYVPFSRDIVEEYGEIGEVQLLLYRGIYSMGCESSGAAYVTLSAVRICRVIYTNHPRQKERKDWGMTVVKLGIHHLCFYI